MKLVIPIILLSAVCAAQQPLPRGRSIEGSLKGDDGSTLAGGRVLLQRLPPYPARSRITQWRAIADEKGNFRFDYMPTGQFRLCASLPGTSWLNPCEWGTPRTPISIGNDQITTSANVVLSKGVVVTIRVDDPGQLLTLHEGKTAGAHLLLGVQNDASVFVPALQKSKDGTGKNFELLVPSGEPRKLTVSSAFFRLVDAAGSPLSRTSATQIPLQGAALRLVVIGGDR